MRKADMIRENERLRCRVRELENILCPAEQHDFHEARLWYEPDCEKMFAVSMLTCRELICKRCFARKIVKNL